MVFSVDPGVLGDGFSFARHKIGTLNQISPIEILFFQPTERGFEPEDMGIERIEPKKPWGKRLNQISQESQ